MNKAAEWIIAISILFIAISHIDFWQFVKPTPFLLA